jgi:hypothetical protein
MEVYYKQLNVVWRDRELNTSTSGIRDYLTVSRNSDLAYTGSIVTLTPICTARGQEHRASFRIVRLLCFDKITSPWYSEGCSARGDVMWSCRHCRRNYVTRTSKRRKVRDG